MVQVAVYNQDNGHVGLIYAVHPVGKSHQDIIDTTLPAGKPYRMCDHTALPKEPVFYEAWRADLTNAAPVFSIDMVEARRIFSERMHRAATALLQKNAAEELLASGPARTTLTTQDQNVAAAVQAVDVSTAADITALKALWPAAIGSNPFA